MLINIKQQQKIKVVLFVECLLVLGGVTLPIWLFPQHTSHDIVTMCHKLYPAFMNGCRCICGSFYQDSQSVRLKLLTELNESVKLNSSRISTIGKLFLDKYLEADHDDSNSPE